MPLLQVNRNPRGMKLVYFKMIYRAAPIIPAWPRLATWLLPLVYLLVPISITQYRQEVTAPLGWIVYLLTTILLVAGVMALGTLIQMASRRLGPIIVMMLFQGIFFIRIIAREFFVYQGQVEREVDSGDCDPGNIDSVTLTGNLPPSPCEQAHVWALTDGYAAQFHRCKATTVCAMLSGGEIHAAAGEPGIAEIQLGAGDEMEKFARHGARVDFQDRQGLAALVVGTDGTVIRRRFFELCTNDRASVDFAYFLRSLTAEQALILASRGRAWDCLDDAARGFLGEFGLGQIQEQRGSGTLAFVGRRGADSRDTLLTFNPQGQPVTLKIRARECRKLFPASP